MEDPATEVKLDRGAGLERYRGGGVGGVEGNSTLPLAAVF